MFAVALSVAACLRAGTRVDVAWIVEGDSFDDRDRNEALAVTPGGGRIGSLLGGAADASLLERSRLSAAGGSGRLVDVVVGEVDALVAGLSHGGSVRCLLVPADELPERLWELLIARQPVGLVTRLNDTAVAATSLVTPDPIAGAPDIAPDAAELFGRKRSDTVIRGDTVVSVFWPVPRLVVVGTGPVADALASAARLVGWHTDVTNDAPTAAGMIAATASIDGVLVAAHDLELAGAALAAALTSDAGYVGALGGARMQAQRADWLAYRGVTDLSRIHGPAGFDIGAETPSEIAISIIAEALAVTRRASTT